MIKENIKKDTYNCLVSNKKIIKHNQDNYNLYKNKGYICFSVHIKQEYNENKNCWNKKTILPSWKNITINDNYFNSNYNSLALLTGEKNNITVLDVDDIDKFKSLLKQYSQNEPNTVWAISGSGGRHYYFKYTNNPNVRNTSNSFGKDSKIDIRNDGGCIYIPTSRYYNYNIKKFVEYKWVKSIFDYELEEFPEWLVELLENNNKKDKNLNNSLKKEKLKDNIVAYIEENNEKNNDEINNNIIEKNIEEIVGKYNNKYGNVVFTKNEIEKIVNLLSFERIDNYSSWIELGMCLHNINKSYITIWDRVSKKSAKYKDGECENKWMSFEINKDENEKIFTIGTLFFWANKDNPEEFKKLKQDKKLNEVIVLKFPKENLDLGETIIVNKDRKYKNINSEICLIKGKPHYDFPNSMYVDIALKSLSIKCQHKECFGKTYPCDHVIKLNKYELNQAFYNNITIINNNYNNTENVEFTKFKKINIYDNEELNKLVYKGLCGKSEDLAKIINYYCNNNIYYTIDKDWYIFENHKWDNEGKISSSIIVLISDTIYKVYSKLFDYYENLKKNCNDNEEIKSINYKLKKIEDIINSVKDINVKENIIRELGHIHTKNNKTKKINFLSLLDSNSNLIGFDNGVYDLENNEFRDGRPEDYVSMTVGYNYTNEYSKYYNELSLFLENIFQDKAERDYFLMYLSTGLYGNILEYFTILTGKRV